MRRDFSLGLRGWLVSIAVCIAGLSGVAFGAQAKPWEHGDLKASENGEYLEHADGTPFFWLGDTGWLLPQRLDRDEAEHYLANCEKEGFNAVQVQVLNDVPSLNAYGALSHPDGWNMEAASRPGIYGYWEHMDHIIDSAARHGIYVGMVCIWGGLVKGGKMTADDAKAYGKFLAERYGSRPNIVWIIGGDVEGSVKPEVWTALAKSIKSADRRHLMTFHPRGRTTSARWWADADWIDFHTFQSGHRRYGQRMGNKDYPIPDGTEEDNWMYVDSVRKHTRRLPVFDSEPSYEDIPQGLHSAEEPKWTAKDVRRYAYWSVFGGACGHTYGHNAIMQFVRPGIPGAYFADGEDLPWWKALSAPGRTQMKHLRNLMESVDAKGRKNAQHMVIDNGTGYDRLAATAGEDWLMVYNHTGLEMHLDLAPLGAGKKEIRIMNPEDGTQRPIGITSEKEYVYNPEGEADLVLICRVIKD